MKDEIINGLSILHEWEGWAEGCAKRARDINEYSPYAELRDAMRKAIAATDEIAKCSPSVRAHMEGRAA